MHIKMACDEPLGSINTRQFTGPINFLILWHKGQSYICLIFIYYVAKREKQNVSQYH